MNRLVYGAAIGDYYGSEYEFSSNVRDKPASLRALSFTDGEYTDDTVMTVAVADSLMTHQDPAKMMRLYARKYPCPRGGYGGMFLRWLKDSTMGPYGSFGNGAGMRVTSIGYIAKDEDEVIKLADLVTKVSHDHPEGIKGARTVALMVYKALHDAKRDELWEFAKSQYDVSFSLEDLHQHYRHIETCQDSIPQALYCFLSSDSFLDCLKRVCYIGGDADTIGAMACGIASAYYRKIPDSLFVPVRESLPEHFREVLDNVPLPDEKRKGVKPMAKELMTAKEVMDDTEGRYKTDEDLKNSIKESIAGTKLSLEKSDAVDLSAIAKDAYPSAITVENKSTLEAASEHVRNGEKVCVVDFADNRSVGGEPYYSSGQEQSLCHASTLLACLEARQEDFYQPHEDDFNDGLMNDLGSDDAMYIPGVTVFKSAERTPDLLVKQDWYKLGVLVTSAPDLTRVKESVWLRYVDLNHLLRKRIQRALSLIAAEDYDVLVLGAYGCGTYSNDPEVVSKAFHDVFALDHATKVKKVVFAIPTSNEKSRIFLSFKEEFSK